MTYKNRLIDKLNLPPRAKLRPEGDGVKNGGDITEMMLDPRYLRQSSSLINEALQKGFDVLQLEDGEIIMTGTRTIVYRYQWDAEKAKLTKVEIPVDEEQLRRESLVSIEGA
jgi:hypothetical protein